MLRNLPPMWAAHKVTRLNFVATDGAVPVTWEKPSISPLDFI
jgi:hypothetical protein